MLFKVEVFKGRLRKTSNRKTLGFNWHFSLFFCNFIDTMMNKCIIILLINNKCVNIFVLQPQTKWSAVNIHILTDLLFCVRRGRAVWIQTPRGVKTSEKRCDFMIWVTIFIYLCGHSDPESLRDLSQHREDSVHWTVSCESGYKDF